ncbi:hypothetical protein E1263_17980 [Kribbella antibiotica]|uniref:Acetyl xylan esterase domain-containing protein n=1 Tax=Kribbella antibiotica TaxID=190195 RepID=A0A4V6PE67_9ACTN|nr:acetylxylan esterase [Kribbella antibiotica]TDD58707.1 hypothetical protein E1263_17980 [Kribbella antibiotica]
MDFASYWNAVDDELAGVAARPVLEPVPARTTAEATSFTVRLTSVGPHRIFGSLSIPAGEGPFPGLLQVPRYGSVNNMAHLNDRSRYVVLTLMHRGQRLSDQSFQAAYPGLLTLGIDDPATYVYRGIVADCLRAAEFLSGLAQVDRVAAVGNELAILTAARRPSVSAVRVSDMVLYRAMEARLRSSHYPLEELNDHLRTGSAAEALEHTLSYFDPIRHARSVAARTLIGVEDVDWYAPLMEALPAGESYEVTHFDGTDADFYDAWLAGQLGVPAMSKFVR